MINQDFTEYPEHRVGLYRLLRAINGVCFPGMIAFLSSIGFLSNIVSSFGRIAPRTVQTYIR